MKQTLSFNDHQVRVIVEPNSETWFCVYDILKIIKRPQMQSTFGLYKLCPSICKMSFEDKSLNFIKKRDIKTLFNLVRNENASINRTCKLMEEWLPSVPELLKKPQVNTKPKESNDMENNIQIFNNPAFGEIRVAGTSEQPLFCAKDVAVVLGYADTADAIQRHCKSGKKVFCPHGNGIGGVNMIYITEKDVYRLVMRSNLPDAEKFQDWVCDEVLPSIRRHGAYMTADTLEKAITSPDFLIQLATQMKEERALRLEAEEKAQQLQISNDHKSEVIESLTTGISLADMRQRITQICRKGRSDKFNSAYSLLYKEFEKKYHINVMARINNCGYKGNAINYIDCELNMVPELYELACKLFEASYEQLMNDWGKTVKRARKSE